MHETVMDMEPRITVELKHEMVTWEDFSILVDLAWDGPFKSWHLLQLYIIQHEQVNMAKTLYV